MRSHLKTFLCITMVGLAAFASCKKKDDSPQAKLKGNWRVVKAGHDDNHNSLMDAAELITWPDSLSSIYTFNSDGTGTKVSNLTGTSVTENYTWTLINSNAQIKITYTSGPSNGMVFTGILQTLAPPDLTIKDTVTTSGILNTTWTFYKKQ